MKMEAEFKRCLDKDTPPIDGLNIFKELILKATPIIHLIRRTEHVAAYQTNDFSEKE